MAYMQAYTMWLENEYIDDETKAELRALEGNDKEIEDRFYTDLAFGTGGLRGVIGAGTNRINKYTVGKVTQGLANFIVKQGQARMDMGVAIAHDSRRMSPEFAEYTALVLNANGIKSYIFDELKPTPELSFALRQLKATAGVIITASHNPPEYNGYKVYWDDGAQVTAPYDQEILDEVNAITDLSAIKFANKDEAVKSGLFNVIGPEIEDDYIKNVTAQVQNPEALRKNADQLKIVYTPLNGTGNKLVRRALKEVGFNHVFVVPEQENPDSEFTTVGYPNPEDPKVFELGIRLAEKEDADIILATDPDCDRVGAVVKDDSGKYIIITGNMSGSLLTHYILESRKNNGTLPADGVVIKTIVSTEMVRPMCKEYGAELVEVLTGFKFIGQKMKSYEENGDHTYLFGFEESYGCLCGTYARDKDAVVATMLICELAAKLKSEGKTLYDGLQELYKKYGYYKEEVKSVTFAGLDGLQTMTKMMDSLRAEPPATFGGIQIAAISDIKTGKKKDIAAGTEAAIDLPPSNVLKFELTDGSWVCVRPSGTEPKIKFYIGVCSDAAEASDEKIAVIKKDVDAIVAKFQ